MEKLKELINRRRRQILVHSFLYYQMNENIISDYTFDQWCKELADIQIKYPEVADQCIYAEEFKSFDGSSGYDLPFHYPNIRTNALQLLNYHKKLKTSG